MGIHRLSALAVLGLCAAALAGCGDPAEAQAIKEDNRRTIAASVEIHIAKEVFESPAFGRNLPQIRPFYPGILMVVDSARKTPPDWGRSRDEQGSSGTYAPSRHLVAGLHPEAEFHLTSRVKLPGYVCAMLLIPPESLDPGMGAATAMAATSKCAPVPGRLESDGEEAATAQVQKALDSDGAWPDPIDLVIDSVAGPATLGAWLRANLEF